MGVERYVLKPDGLLLPLYRVSVKEGAIIALDYSDAHGGANYRLVDNEGEPSIYSKTSTQPSSSPSLLSAMETLGYLVLNGEDLEEADRLHREGFRPIELEEIPYDAVKTAFTRGTTIGDLCKQHGLIEHKPDT